MTYNPKIKNISKEEIQVDAKITATNVSLGEPEPAPDNTYEDGLFVFTNTDNVGTAIDKINEVLAKLAPPPAPDLKTITAYTTNSTYTGRKEYLSNVEGYYNKLVDLQDPNGNSDLNLQTVGEDGLFSPIEKGGTTSGNTEYIRLGTIAIKQNLYFVLNGTVEENKQGEQTNYPDNAFNSTVAPTNFGDIEVHLNGVKITDTFIVTLENNLSSGPNDATFASGEKFDGFKHSVMVIRIRYDADWKTGHNHVQIKYADKSTSYVDWVHVPGEADHGVAQYSITTTPDGLQIVENESEPTKFISGIAYAEKIVVKLADGNNVVNKYAIQSYPENFGVSIEQALVVQNKTAEELKSYLDSNKIDKFTNTLDISDIKTDTPNNSRAFNQNPQIVVKVENEHGKTGTTTSISGKPVFFDNVTDNSTTGLVGINNMNFELFDGENNRVTSVNTIDRSSVAWNSAASLPQNQAIIFEGKLSHSRRANINLTDGVDRYPLQDNLVDFTVRTGDEVYIRKFTYNSDVASLKLQIECTENLFFSSMIGTGWKIQFLNGKNVWVDAIASHSQGGIGIGTLLSNQTGTVRTLEIQFPAEVAGSTSLFSTLGTHYFKITIPETDQINYIESIKVLAIS